jgi:hypothetical protein
MTHDEEVEAERKHCAQVLHGLGIPAWLVEDAIDRIVRECARARAEGVQLACEECERQDNAIIAELREQLSGLRSAASEVYKALKHASPEMGWEFARDVDALGVALERLRESEAER